MVSTCSVDERKLGVRKRGVALYGGRRQLPAVRAYRRDYASAVGGQADGIRIGRRGGDPKGKWSYAAFNCIALRRRQPTKPSPARPMAKRVRVEGSGTPWFAKAPAESMTASGWPDGSITSLRNVSSPKVKVSVARGGRPVILVEERRSRSGLNNVKSSDGINIK